ncbi:hypothetical protein D083_0748 [Dickeya solani RNS 08.23.3.1.A]|nr:hypothetical protein D083_0748 [Dickeya solani RNS 08.23.3.1.A]
MKNGALCAPFFLPFPLPPHHLPERAARLAERGFTKDCFTEHRFTQNKPGVSERPLMTP